MIKKFNDFIFEGYLSKQAYDGKRNYADRKMELNKDKGLENGLTDEQCDALSALCSTRHDLHSNMDKIVRSDEYGYKNKLLSAIDSVEDSGLPRPKITGDCGRLDDAGYIDIDDIQNLYEYEDVPEDENEKKAWFEDNYERIYDELSRLNAEIENYLKSIDLKYKTNYCPTGASRIF